MAKKGQVLPMVLSKMAVLQKSRNNPKTGFSTEKHGFWSPKPPSRPEGEIHFVLLLPSHEVFKALFNGKTRKIAIFGDFRGFSGFPGDLKTGYLGR